MLILSSAKILSKEIGAFGYFEVTVRDAKNLAKFVEDISSCLQKKLGKKNDNGCEIV